jgi:hypothetical protein
MNPIAYQNLYNEQITINSTIGNSIVHQCDVENSCEEYYKKP